MKKSSRTVTARIHKLNGQLTAVENMIKDNRKCSDILHQISAVRAGVEQIAVLVFQSELRKLTRKKKVTLEDIQYLSEVFTKTT